MEALVSGRTDINTRESEQAKKKMEYVSHWDCLPDLLILFIFNKILDAKSLIQCSLVSKHFFFLVQQTENVLIRIRDPHLSLPHIHDLAPLDGFRNLIKTFRRIKSLQIVFHTRPRPNETQKARQRSNLVYGSSFGEFCLSFAHCPSSLPEYLSGQFNLDWSSDGNKSYSKKLVENYGLISRHLLTHEFVKQHSMLKDVVIRDDKNLWRVSLGEELLASLRISCSGDEAAGSSDGGTSCVTVPRRMIVWYTRSLNLPRNGSSVEHAVLVVLRSGVESIVMEKDAASLLLGNSGGGDGDGDGEEGNICDEVVMEILNKKNKKKAFELEYCPQAVFVNPSSFL